MKQKNNLLITIIVIIFIVIFFISSYFITKNYLEDRKSKNDSANLIKEVINTTDIEDDTKKNVIAWDKLKSINEDIVGWIIIPDTNINYPILKSDNDLYYLTHSFNREYNRNGAIFLTNENIWLFQDEEITIYGHHMRDGLMFGTLKNYMDRDFYNTHSTIYIYTPNANYEGKIFSVFSRNIFKVENELRTLNFNERIDYYKSNSIYQDLDENNTDKIVRLMTCSYINARTNPTEERYYIIVSLKKVD